MSSWSYFSVQSPINFIERIVRDDGSIALTTYNTSTSNRIGTDTSIYLYPDLASFCAPTLTGLSESTELTESNGKTSWGRLDKYQWRQDQSYPDALCTVPFSGCTKDEIWSGDGCQHGQGAYALCSKKDGKTVVICISQMTDNPQLAEEIFRTFRWTDE